MELVEYEKLAAADERMWWFRGLQTNLVESFRRAGAPPGALLDAGCGAGGLLARLASSLPERDVLGIDLDPRAASLAHAKSGRPVCTGSVHALPFAAASLAGIFSADVLCHRGVDEAATLGEFRRCLAPGGLLLLNLPAYPWLFSGHDLAVDNVRRYTRAGIRRLLAGAGFATLAIGFWNSFLFPLMLVRRKLKPARGPGSGAASDVGLLPAPLEAAFRAVIGLESLLLAHGVRLPFGGSLIAVARKPGRTPP